MYLQNAHLKQKKMDKNLYIFWQFLQILYEYQWISEKCIAVLKRKKQEMYEVDWSHDQTLKDFSEDLIMHQQSSHKI